MLQGGSPRGHQDLLEWGGWSGVSGYGSIGYASVEVGVGAGPQGSQRQMEFREEQEEELTL